MMNLYRFPEKAAFGRPLPKTRIYEHAAPGAKVKQAFVRDVEKITWSYKLSPDTINLPAGEGVEEMQIFSVSLRSEVCSHDLLLAMDKAIPSPILFILGWNGKSRYAAAYKRPGGTGKGGPMVSRYFETGWISDEAEKIELPIVLNLGILYQTVLKSIIPLAPRKDEGLEEIVLRAETVRTREREMERLGAVMNRERQFNRRVEMNQTLNGMKREIETLKQ
jgi:hypothetical protein